MTERSEQMTVSEQEPYGGAKPYHHGNLRAALLTAAEQTLREHGVEQVTLRNLARQAGVSHGAPNRHFRDRQALLDALAAVGYARLGDAVAAAVERAGEGFEPRLRATAAAFVHFAIENSALLELMTVSGKSGRPDQPGKIYQRPYLLLKELIQQGHESGELRPGDPERLQLIILASFQGIAALVNSWEIPLEQADELIADAAALFLRG